MPEAPVNEKAHMESRENKIGPSGEIPTVEAIPQSEAVQESPHLQFRLGVLTAYAAHVLASALCGQSVHERSVRHHGSSNSGPAPLSTISAVLAIGCENTFSFE